MKFYKKICLLLVVIFLVPMLVIAAKDTNYSNDIIYSLGGTIYFAPSTEKGVDSVSLPQNFEGNPLIPDAFLVADEYIFIDDACNSRIQIYKNKKHLSSIELEWYIDVKELYLNEERNEIIVAFLNLEVTDTSCYQVISYDIRTGDRISESTKISKDDHELLNFFFDDTGKLQGDYLKFDKNKPLDSSRNMKFLIDKSILDEFCKDSKGNANPNILDTYCETIGFDGDSKIVKYGIMADNLKGHYCFSEYVVKLTDGKVVEYVETLTNNHKNTTGNIIYDSMTGNYYQLIVDASNIVIFQLEKRKVESLKYSIGESVIEGQNLASSLITQSSQMRTTYSSQNPSNVRTRMDTYKNYSWSFDSDINGDITIVPLSLRSYVTQPTWLAALSDGASHNVTGIPYCWGGWNAQSFSTYLAASHYAGNIESTYDYQTTNTIGMDCSGYVSVAYDLPYKHGTTTLGDCFTDVNKYEVRPYYILNKYDSHVRITSRAYVSSGTMYVDYYEESSSVGKVRRLTAQNYNSIYSDGYRPAIYDVMPVDLVGNRISQACSVTSPLNKTDYISYSQDTDTYKFIPSTTKTYTIETTGSRDTCGTLLNSSGTSVLAYDDDSGSSFNFKTSISLTAGVTYYIQVSGYSEGTQGVYYLQIN